MEINLNFTDTMTLLVNKFLEFNFIQGIGQFLYCGWLTFSELVTVSLSLKPTG